MLDTHVADVIEFLSDRILDSRVVDATLLITFASPLDQGGDLSLTFAVGCDEETYRMIRSCGSSLVIVDAQAIPHVLESRRNVIAVERPRREFARVMHEFSVPSDEALADSVVGPDSVIENGAFVDPHNVIVGSDCHISHNAVILPGTTLGDRVTVGPGAVIGHTGFSYEREADGTPVPIPHLAGVTLGDDVEVGANACIDRGVFRDTRIDNHVKIDNLVQIGHNVAIGKGSYIIANSVICGSVRIGEHAWIGPGSVVMEGLRIGDRATVGMNSTVIRSVPDGNTIMAPAPRTVPSPTHGH